ASGEYEIEDSATYGEFLFFGRYAVEEELTQYNSTIRRDLIPLDDSGKVSELKRYLLLETDLEDTSYYQSCNVVSKNTIPMEIDLFTDITLNNKGISYFHQGETDESIKLILRKDDTDYEFSSMRDMMAPCDPNSSSTMICIDWYLITYDIFTNIVVSEEYQFSTCSSICMQVGGGGGGGGGGSEEEEPTRFRTKTWTVYQHPPELGAFEVKASENCWGRYRSSDPQGGHFTKVTHHSSTCNGLDVLYFETYSDVNRSDSYASSRVRGQYSKNGAPLITIEGYTSWRFDSLF
ncbi:MAG: hypothetical protein J0H92_19655, partial [Sphingobacteriales bacterium]|nr:hypothetical protein [Sphingobacteriales bacterium]